MKDIYFEEKKQGLITDLVGFWLEEDWGYYREPDEYISYNINELIEGYDDFVSDMEVKDWIKFAYYLKNKYKE